MWSRYFSLHQSKYCKHTLRGLFDTDKTLNRNAADTVSLCPQTSHPFSTDTATVQPVRLCPAKPVRVFQVGTRTVDRRSWIRRRTRETAAASRLKPAFKQIFEVKECANSETCSTFWQPAISWNWFLVYITLAGSRLQYVIGLVASLNATNIGHHVNYVYKRANSRLHFLRQLKRAATSPEDMLLFYIAVIRPVMEYAAPVWHTGLTTEPVSYTHLTLPTKRIV